MTALIRTEELKDKALPLVAAQLPASIISRELNVSPATANRLQNDPAIRAKVERLRSKMADEAFDDAIDNLITMVKTLKTPLTKDPETKQYDYWELRKRDYAIDISKDIAKSIGILPSHAESQYITNIFNDNSVNIESPVISRILERSSRIVEGDLARDDEE